MAAPRLENRATIYERQLMRMQQEEERKRQKEEQDYARRMEWAKFGVDRQDREFARKYKMAELYGKVAQQLGGPVPEMRDEVLQEQADLSHASERARLPAMKAEYDIRNDFKWADLQGKNQRAAAGIQSRETIAQLRSQTQKELLAEKQKYDKPLQAARLKLTAAETALKEANTRKSKQDLANAKADLLKLRLGQYEGLARSLESRANRLVSFDGRPQEGSDELAEQAKIWRLKSAQLYQSFLAGNYNDEDVGIELDAVLPPVQPPMQPQPFGSGAGPANEPGDDGYGP